MSHLLPISRSNAPIQLAVFFAVTFVFSACLPPAIYEPLEYQKATQIVLDWNRLLLELERHTPGYRPPVSARMFAYAEMAAYEASLPSMNGYISMESTCPGYLKPAFPTEKYHLTPALNAAYAHIVRAFFPTAPKEQIEKMDHLESKHARLAAENIDPNEVLFSIAFGKKTAAAVWQYSVQDSVGHDGFMYNFDRNFKMRTCNGCWVSDAERPMPPLLPSWGAVRPFVAKTQVLIAKPPVPFDEGSRTAFYAEALEVFSISKSLSAEDRWVAEFWSDDVPGLTITPIGRWISITNQAVEQSALSFPEVMETYLKTAIALCDAAIICWDNKYKFQVERPQSFIRRNIQADWMPFHSSPSFPSYPSGHAIFGAAAAEILSETLGAKFTLTDRTHEGRKEFAGKPRKFRSFEEMANENAYSRVLIGVHFRMDCEEGLRLGKLVGKNVLALSLKTEKIAVLRLNE